VETGFSRQSRSNSLESITFMILDRFDPESSRSRTQGTSVLQESKESV